MERLTGTCEWFATKNESFGFIIYHEEGVERHIFAHWKNIEEKNQRDPNHRELKPNDVVSFIKGDGFHMEGTQALQIRIEVLADADNY
jgi:cold shock CspA family protein